MIEVTPDSKHRYYVDYYDVCGEWQTVSFIDKESSERYFREMKLANPKMNVYWREEAINVEKAGETFKYNCPIELKTKTPLKENMKTTKYFVDVDVLNKNYTETYNFNNKSGAEKFLNDMKACGHKAKIRTNLEPKPKFLVEITDEAKTLTTKHYFDNKDHAEKFMDVIKTRNPACTITVSIVDQVVEDKIPYNIFLPVYQTLDYDEALHRYTKMLESFGLPRSLCAKKEENPMKEYSVSMRITEDNAHETKHAQKCGLNVPVTPPVKEKTVKDRIIDVANMTNTESIMKKNNFKPGFVVLHQNIGSLPPYNAEAFCERVKDKFTKTKEWLEFKAMFPNWNFLLVPSRTEESRVEVYHEDDCERKKVIGEIVQRVTNEDQPIQDSEKLRNRVKDYVKLMLGAPVVKLEFTEDQLDFCYEHSLNIIHDAASMKKRYTMTDSYFAQSEDFLQAGALAHAMIILARIRMHQAMPKDTPAYLEPRDMYEEGVKRLANWKKAMSIPFAIECGNEDEELLLDEVILTTKSFLRNVNVNDVHSVESEIDEFMMSAEECFYEFIDKKKG